MDIKPDCQTVTNNPASERLRHCKADILAQFEKSSRENVAAASDKDSYTVQDELAKFIDELVQALARNHANVSHQQDRIAILHGQQRSGIEDYTLMQVIQEYGLLREVLVDVLLTTGPLSEIERRVIHRTFDNAVELAANEFANAEKAKIKLVLAEVEQSNRDLEHIAEVLAHDLRSPLGTIAGFTDLLEDDLSKKLDKQSADSIQFIRGAVGRMTKLIDQVLSYAKLKGTKPEFAPVDCNEVVQAVVQNLKSLITEASGRTQHADLPVVQGNFSLLAQVFQNLFANAIKFRSPDRHLQICVKAEDKDDHWLFSVQDNGSGFDPENKEFIFGLYNKAGSQGNSQGAGIGLATCRRVIELHGGKIWADSKPGEGSTFCFALPKRT